MNNNLRRRLLILFASNLFCILILLMGTDAARAVASRAASSRGAYAPPVEKGLEAAADVVMQQTTPISVTKRGELLDDVDGDGNADPGDSLRYTILVTNTGADVAENVLIRDALDAGLSLVGDVRVSPIAVDDHYSVLGNTVITVVQAAGVLGNDVTPDPGVITANAVSSGLTAEGGDISLRADGSLTYDPPAGFQGTDTFAYEIVHENGLAGRGTIFFDVDDVIWYLDDDAGNDGDGRQSAPFKELSEVQAEAGVGDVIFLYEGSYTGTLTLLDEQKLVGQGVGIASVTTVRAPAGSTLPAVAGRPTLTGGVTLAEDNGVHGLNIHAGGATATALAGANIGNLTVSETSIGGSGRALDLHNGRVSATFDSVSSASSNSQGINLSGLLGTLQAGSGSITGADGSGFQVTNNSATINYSGSITSNQAGAYAVRIFDNSSGQITLSGAISSSGSSRGVSLTGNGFMPINLEGRLTLDTGTNTAFTASGGGRIRANATGNSVSTAGATAVIIDGVTIVDGVRFQSVSAQNSTKGIVLNGVQGGPVSVSGVGSNDGSGGTMSNISQRAIEVVNTNNVSFANMTLTNANTADSGGIGVCDTLNTSACYAGIYLRDAGNITLSNVDISGNTAEQAINGINVAGFTLSNSTISNCGNEVNEGCVKMRNLTGTATLSGVTLSAAAAKVMEVHNESGVLNLTVQSSTFRDTQLSGVGADGLEVITKGSAAATVTVANSQFLRNRTNGLQVSVEDNSSLTLNASDSTFDSSGAIGLGLVLAVEDSGTLAFNVIDNVVHSYGGNAITVAAFDESDVDGRISGNTDIQVGGPGTSGHGITVQGNENASGRIAIEGNTISNVGFDDGIFVTARPGAIAAATGRMDFTISNNNVGVTSDSYANINLLVQGTSTLCADVANNTATGGGVSSYAFRVREASATATMLLEGYATSAAATWTAKGNNGAPVNESPAPGTAAAGACEDPRNPVLAAGVDSAAMVYVPADVTGDSMRAGSETVAPAGKMVFEAREPLSLAKAARLAETARLAAAPVQQTGDDVAVGPFNLPAGKTVTVVFEVQIADPFPAGAAQVENQARVSGSNFAQALSDDPETAAAPDPTVTLVAAMPDLTLDKDAGAITTEPGNTVIYTLTYGNGGNQHASPVVITETVPAYAAFNATASSGGWSCADGSAAGEICVLDVGTVEAGAPEASASFAVDVMNPLPAGAALMENAASIGVDSAYSDDAEPLDNEASESITLVAQPDLGLTKLDGGIDAVPGATLTYTLRFSNAGNQGATGVTIREVVPENSTFNAGPSTAGWACGDGGVAGASCTLNVGALDGGESGTVAFAVTVDNVVAASVTALENSASIVDDGANGADGNGTDNGDTIITELDAAPDLYLEKDDGDVTARSGDLLEYTLTLTNEGNQGAVGVVITETVPAHTSFNPTESDVDWSCMPDNNAGSVCALAVVGELGGGSSIAKLFAVDVIDSLPAGVTSVQNQAEASGSNAGSVTSDDPNTADSGDATVSALEVRADLAVSKDDGVTVAVPGEALTYTIVVRNLGPDTVEGATVRDNLTPELYAATWGCEAGASAACGNATGSGALLDTPDLGAGSVITYRVNVMVHAAATGTLRNVATVTAPAGVSDAATANNSDQDDDTLLAPEVDLVLGLVESNDPVVAGSGSGNLQYTLTLTNAGPSLATGVTVSNMLTLPARVTLEGMDFDGAASTYAGDTWTVSALNAGESETLTVRLTAGASAEAGSDVVGMEAEVSGAGQTISNSADDAVSESTSVARSVDVQLAASASLAAVTAGSGTGNLTFVVTATNAGPSAASGVVIDNALSLPAGVSLDSVTPETGTAWEGDNESWLVGDLAAGDSATLTLVVTVGPAALPGSDTISNAATLASVDEIDGNDGNDSATAVSSVVTEADLVLSVADTPDPALAGTQMTYTVWVTNNGPSLARNVQAATTLDGALALVASEGCAEDPNGAPDCSLGAVAPGTTSVFTQSVQIDSAATGILQSSVAVTADTAEGNAGDESETESTTLESAADLSIWISAQPATALAGYPLTYTVAITNGGPSRATGLELTVMLPAALSVENNSCDALEASALEAGATAECEISGVVDAGYSGAISATATVSAATADSAPANNSHTHETTVTNNQFSISDVQATEGNTGLTAFTFTITRTSNAVASTVDVTTLEDTALAGEDFLPLATTVEFVAGGSLTQTVTVSVLGDAVVELDEAFGMQLSDAVNGGIDDGEGLATIANDDSATVDIVDVQQAEGYGGASNLVFELSLSAAVDNPVSVAFATADDTAEDEGGDGDYAASSGTVMFDGDDGETESIVVAVNGDGVMEVDETFAILLSALDAGGRNVILSRNEATGTIENDDVALVDFSRANGVVNESEGTATFTVTLSLPAAYTVTVDYASHDGSAVAGEDYTPISGALQFAPGETALGVTLTALDDTVDEDDETVTLSLSNLSAGVLGTDNNPATLVIVDDDGEPTAGFTSFEYREVENAAGAVISVTLSHVSGRDVSVVVSSSDGTASGGTDYSVVSETLTIPAGQRVVTFTVPYLDDVLDEDDETVALTLREATNAALGAVNEATLLIVDDDGAPEITFSTTEYTTAENAGAVVITLTLSHASGLDVTAVINSSDGTAVAGEDYGAISETVTIPAGEQTVTLSLPVMDDVEEEADETVIVTIGAVVNGTAGADAEATVIIEDDDVSEAQEYIYYFPLSVKQATKGYGGAFTH